jgi:hypothetical protein
VALPPTGGNGGLDTLAAVDVVLWITAAVLAVLAVSCGLAATVAPGLERAVRIGVELAQGLMLVLVGADLLAWAAGGGPEEPVVHVGYCVAAVALIPLVVMKPKAPDDPDDPDGPDDQDGGEPEPSSLWVLAIAVAAVAVVVWRMAATR